MNMFIDDERIAPYPWIHIYSGEDLIEALKNSTVTIDTLSMDHDLGSGIDGYETLKKIVYSYPEVLDKVMRIQFHTDNAVGRTNMYKLLKNAQRCHVISDRLIVSDHILEHRGTEIFDTGLKIS